MKKLAYIINTKDFDSLVEYVYAMICNKINNLNVVDLSKEQILAILDRIEERVKNQNQLVLFSKIKEFSGAEKHIGSLALWFHDGMISLHKVENGKVFPNLAIDFTTKQALANFLFKTLCSKPNMKSPHPDFKLDSFQTGIKIVEIPNFTKLATAFLNNIKNNSTISLFYPNIDKILIRKENNLFYFQNKEQSLKINEALSEFTNLLKDEVYVVSFSIVDSLSMLNAELLETFTSDILIYINSIMAASVRYNTNLHDVITNGIHHEIIHALQSAASVGFSEQVLEKNPNIYGTTKKTKDPVNGLEYEFSAYLSGLTNLARKKYETANEQERKDLERLLFTPLDKVPAQFRYLKEEIEAVLGKTKDPEVRKKVIHKYLKVLKGI